jgi:hypothetical protein
MIEASGPSTSEFQECYPKCCARPTGVGMFAPLMVLRNASRAKSEGRAKGGGGLGR